MISRLLRQTSDVWGFVCICTNPTNIKEGSFNKTECFSVFFLLSVCVFILAKWWPQILCSLKGFSLMRYIDTSADCKIHGKVNYFFYFIQLMKVMSFRWLRWSWNICNLINSELWSRKTNMQIIFRLLDSILIQASTIKYRRWLERWLSEQENLLLLQKF